MKEDVVIKNGIVIPGHELEITASRSGGAGGQHVNKTSTRITVRWNILQSYALNEEQKKRVLEKLANEITKDGDIIVHHGGSRSQQHNKKVALDVLAQKINRALRVPKKRMKTHVSKETKEKRLQEKKRHGEIKKMRKKIDID